MPFEPAPKEAPVTLKPSAAIRLGCIIAPEQCVGSHFSMSDSGVLRACAQGAFALGMGFPVAEARAIGSRVAHCFIDSNNDGLFAPLDTNGLYWRISCMNDDGQSREQIAAWLETQGF